MTVLLCRLATEADHPGTYADGPDPTNPGFGATFTFTATGMPTIDGEFVLEEMVVLFKDQTDEAQNGIYVCTTEGDVGISPVFTRVGLFSSPDLINTFGQITVVDGNVNRETTWIVNNTIFEVGVDPIQISQIVIPQGSTRIHTVGTITTGTWDADNVTAPDIESTGLLTTNGRMKKVTYVTDASYTVLTTDEVIFCDRAGTVDIQLISSLNNGRTFTISDVSGAAAANNITITAPVAQTINGSTTYVINTNYGAVTLINFGTLWSIV